MSQQTQPYGPGSSGPGSAGSGSGTKPTSQSANGGPVRISDIKAKLSEIDAEVRGATEVEPSNKRGITVVAVGVVVGVVILAFVLGRKRGRRTTTWVEVRRL